MKKVTVAVIGHTGRLGKPLLAVLDVHPFAEIVYTESRSKGSWGDLAHAEIVFLALPYGESRDYLPRFDGKKIIDLSIDHRDNEDWVYGLPEIFTHKIKRANKIANPGCYATSILLGLYPLKDKIKKVNIASTSGISGAGMSATKEDNFLIYNEGRQHPQIKEVENRLGLSDILFVPQRIDTADKGIISTMFVEVDVSQNLSELYTRAYGDCPFVRIRGTAEAIETKNVLGTNFCDIKLMQFDGNILILAALDNIIKGGVGTAVQNFNLMCGFSETLGLI